MNFAEPYNSWIKSKIGDNIDHNTKFVLKIAAATANGLVDVPMTLDLTWYVLIEADDTETMKLQVAQALLTEPIFLQEFRKTTEKPELKRLIAEFLLFNIVYLERLIQYIDVNQLDAPIDFLSHSLLLKRAEGVDTDHISSERIKIANLIINRGFSLPVDSPNNAQLPVLNKVLSMNQVVGKFELAQRLLDLGFKLFVNNNPRANMEVAVFLINNREKDFCKTMIVAHVDEIKALKLQLPGSKDIGNLADYYYWVQENMDAVHFIKHSLGIQLSSTT